MKRSRKSNRVTWAPAFNLCQIRLFLTEDCPSKVGTQAQDHLQMKTPLMLHHWADNEFCDVPPGFEGSCLNPLKEESSQISKIEWKCPPKVVLSHNWYVAAGEESFEVKAQKVREMRVLEAIFPRHSAIPPSPSISLDVEEEFYDDSFTPSIPLIPIEEGDAPASDLTPSLPKDFSSAGTPASAEFNTSALDLPPSGKPVHGLIPDMGADLMAAASAAVTALMKSTEKGSLIDTGLLIKILSDPKMIEKLINDHQASIDATNAPIPVSDPITKSITPSSFPQPATPSKANAQHLHGAVTTLPVSSGHKSAMISLRVPTDGSLELLGNEVQRTATRVSTAPDMKLIPGIKQGTPNSSSRIQPINMYMPDQVQSTSSTIPARLAPKSFVGVKPSPSPPNLGTSTMPVQPNGIPEANVAAMNTNQIKDINYIKNLIKEHGSDRNNQNISYNGSYGNPLLNKEFGQNLRPKSQKPCMYYRSPKGCRNGADCTYQHDLSLPYQTGGNLEAPLAKRMKMDREIIGRL